MTQEDLIRRLENERIKVLENEVATLRGEVQRLKEILSAYLAADSESQKEFESLKLSMQSLEKICRECLV